MSCQVTIYDKPPIQVKIESVDLIVNGGADEIVVPFSFGDATPSPIFTANAGQLIRTVIIVITTPFDGTNSELSVGDAVNPDRLFPSASIAPTDTATEWEYNPNYRYGSSTVVSLRIVPNGSTQGSGFVFIKKE